MREPPLTHIEITEQDKVTQTWGSWFNNVATELRRMFISINTRTIAGYGGVAISSPQPMGTIDTTFQTIPNMDTGLVDVPFLIGQDTAAGGLRFTISSVYDTTVQVTLTFDELNQGRILAIRLHNVDEDLFTPPQAAFIGRNTEGASVAVSTLLQVASDWVGDLLQVQIGTFGDSFTNATAVEASMTGVHVAGTIGTIL